MKMRRRVQIYLVENGLWKGTFDLIGSLRKNIFVYKGHKKRLNVCKNVATSIN